LPVSCLDSGLLLVLPPIFFLVEMPVPGIPAFMKVPRVPIFTDAPLLPADKLAPDFDKLIDSPLQILILLLNLILAP